MMIVGLLLSLVGFLVSFVASIQLLIAIFKKSGALWLIGSLIVPFVSLVWIVMNWEEGRTPFIRSLVGAGLCIAGSVVTAMFAS